MKTIAARGKVTREERLDRLFRALGDPTRRSMLRRLARGPATVGDLAEPYEMTLPAASKHLRVLERAGLLRRRIHGRVHRCSLNPRQLIEARQWLDHYRRFWDETLDSLARHLDDDAGKAG
jgi:DNA-binding transcriptional ArsR family regulator